MKSRHKLMGSIGLASALLVAAIPVLAQSSASSQSSRPAAPGNPSQVAAPDIGFGSGTGMGPGGALGSPTSVMGGLGAQLGAPGAGTQSFGGGFTPGQFTGPVPPLGLNPGGVSPAAGGSAMGPK